MEDPRTIFYLSQDRQVIVYFDWEGPAGPHKFEALWKNPDGKVTVITDFSYAPKDTRFGGYFTLLLSDTVQTGIWTMEARIDGEAAGSHTFQILQGERPAGEIAKPVRVALSPAQAYQRALGGTVFLEKINAAGERLQTGSGFFVSEDVIITAFQVIDGASKMRAVLADGSSMELTHVIGWNRRQDWAVLKTPEARGKKLERAPANSWAIGDRCYTLDVPGESSRTIAELDLVGKNTYGAAGERLNLSRPLDRRTFGSPLLNEYGEVIGLVGGALLPGSSTLDGPRFGNWFGLLSADGVAQGSLAVPLNMVSLAGAQPTTLEAMLAGGQFAPPLSRERVIMSVNLTRESEKNGVGTYRAGSEFSRKDGTIIFTVHWDAEQKRKGMAILRFFDANYGPLAESKPNKIDLKPGQLRTTAWTFPVDGFPPGVYRIDVYLDAEPVGRTFFRVKE